MARALIRKPGGRTFERSLMVTEKGQNHERDPKDRGDPSDGSDDDETPETPLDEPQPVPVDDPPAEPIQVPYVVGGRGRQLPHES
jgi:hypothetical protein